jgi:hypothetical protein
MAEKRTIELEIQDNSKSLKAQYREAVAELQKVSAQYGETSEQAVKAAKAAAELKDQIGFSKDLVDSFNPDAKFNALSRSVGGVLDGFQAFEGALGLVGVDAEKLQETMVRLQSVMALSQGLQGLMEAKDSFKQLGTVAANALKGIRTGIAATGIGVFVVALGTVVAYWDDIKTAVSGVSDEQKKLNLDAQKNLKTSKEQYDNLQLQENSLKLQGKSEKEILKIKIDKLNASIELAEVEIKRLEKTSKLEIEAAKRNQEITKAIIQGALNFSALGLRLLLAPIDMVLETANLVSEKLGFGKITATNLNKEITKLIDFGAEVGSKFLFDPAQVKADSDAVIKEAQQGLNQMKSDRDGFLLQLKQGNDQSNKDQQKSAQEQLDVTRQIEEERNRIMEESRAKDLDALRIKYKYEKQEADKNFKDGKLKKEDYDKLIKQQEDSSRADIQAVNDKWNKIEKDERNKKLQEQIQAQDEQYNAFQKAQNTARDQELFELMQSYDAKFELAKNNAELEKALTDSFNKEQAAIIEKYRKEEEAKKKEADEKERARIEQLNKDRFQLAKDGLQLVSDLASLFGQQDEKRAKLAFRVDKAAKISSATIAGYEAVLEAYKTGQKSPLTAVFPAYPYIQAGLAGAFAAVNIAKISQAKFQSSGGGGGLNSPAGGGGGAAAPMTANFTTIGSSGINQLAQLQQTPTQAYVVSSEVTSAQALDRNRVQNATL